MITAAVQDTLRRYQVAGIIQSWSQGATGGARAKTFFDIETVTGRRHRFTTTEMDVFVAGVMAARGM